MSSRFKYSDAVQYPTIESNTADDGTRVYFTPAGNAPSVTTILSSLPHPGLDEWRAKVGEEEAARVSKEAIDIGNCMHNMLEAYVGNFEYELTNIPEEATAKRMFQIVRMNALRRLTEVWGIEVPLYYENLYAGRTDLVGVYDGKLSIIDYKTAKYFKKAEWIVDYHLQTAAYAIAHDWLFPDYEIEQAVLLIGTRPNPEYRVPAKCQIITIGKEQLEENKAKWVEVLDGFHNGVAA